MQQIIVPLDGSALAETILPYAALWARTTGAALTLVRLVAPTHTLHPWPEPTPLRARQEWERAECDQADAYLQGVAQCWAAPDLLIHWEVLTGEHIAEQIVTRAQAPDTAMIAMTTHGRSGWRRWMFGSIAHQVVQRAPVPLLLLRAHCTPARRGETPSLRTMVVPLDGSDVAEQALPLAEALAEAAHAEITLVTALPAVDDIGLATGGIEPMWMLADNYAMSQRQEAYLKKLAQRLQVNGRHVRTRCMVDAPAHAILDTRSARAADLVVMTTHGRSGLGEVVLGSVAQQVVNAADVPVLLVRAHPASAEQKGTG